MGACAGQMSEAVAPLCLHSSRLFFYRRQYSSQPAYMAHQLYHGRAFVFARTDWEYVLNTFVFGMAVGYHFVSSSSGSCNGEALE